MPSIKVKHVGATPPSLAALGYDAVLLLSDAIKRAGSTDRDAMGETTGLQGVGGDLHLQGIGRQHRAASVLVRIGGRPVPPGVVMAPLVLRGGLAALLVAALSMPCAAEIPDRTVRIGVLTDMGVANADSTGEGSVVAARLAAEDVTAFMPGIAVSVIGADHQNKADVASSIARDRIANQGINVITDVPVSSAGLAVAEAARGQKRTVFIASGAGASDLTGKRCSPNTLH